MKNEGWKAVFACTIGGGLGALIALQINHYFWWVGLILGGLAGYLSYEWRAVLRAIPAAYRAARGFRVPQFFWRIFFWDCATKASLSFYMWMFFFLLFASLMATSSETRSSIKLLAECFLIIQFTTIIIILLFNFGYLLKISKEPVNLEMKMRGVRDEFGEVGPHRVFFFFWQFFLDYFPHGIWWLVCRIPHAVRVAAVSIAHGVVGFVRFLRRFFWQFFLRIHSEMRLLCGVDSMLGAAVGYFAGSALIGAIAGGSFGLLNYFLVTKAWLEPKGYLPIRLK